MQKAINTYAGGGVCGEVFGCGIVKTPQFQPFLLCPVYES